MTDLMRQEKLRFPEKLFYGTGVCGTQCVNAMITTFLMFFYTDVVGLNPASVGLVLLASKLFDGVSDLVAGTIVDNTHSRWGSARPWMLWMGIPLGICEILLFTVPNCGTVGKLVYVFVSYNIVNTICYTMTQLALMALPAFMTHDQKDRSILTMISIFFSCAMLVVLNSAVLKLVDAFGGGQAGWVKTGIVLGAVSIVFFVLTFLFTKERVSLDKENKEEKIGLLKALKCVITNREWIIVFVIDVMIIAHMSICGSVSVYYATWILHDPNQVGIISMLINLPGLVVIPLSMVLVPKIGKQKCELMGGAFMLAGQIIMIIGQGSIQMLLASSLVRGIGMGFSFAVINGMMMDTIDYGQWKTGVRTQGVLVSAASVSQKLSSGLISALVGMYLSSCGYDGTLTEQPATALQGISNLWLYLPLVLYIAIIILSLIYKLDKQYPQIQADLAAGRTAKDAVEA